MKQIFTISLLLLVAATSLSASKSDKILGKWVMYKMTKNGETRDQSKEKNVPWVTFEADNVLWTGEGKRDKEKGKWWLDDDNKTVYLVLKRRETPMKIHRLSKNKLILKIEDGRKSIKAYWKKAK